MTSTSWIPQQKLIPHRPMFQLRVNKQGFWVSATFADAQVRCPARAAIRPAHGPKAENGNHLSIRSAGPQSPLAEALSERSFV
jgi:hypothetical protein